MPLKSAAHLQIKVYHEDVDLLGVVYNANYLKFMERGRSEWLRSLGVQQRDLLIKDYLFVVRSAQLEFIKPARLGDYLSIITKVIKLGKASVIFKQTIHHAENEQAIFCVGTIKVACVNHQLKPCAIPEEIFSGR